MASFQRSRAILPHMASCREVPPRDAWSTDIDDTLGNTHSGPKVAPDGHWFAGSVVNHRFQRRASRREHVSGATTIRQPFDLIIRRCIDLILEPCEEKTERTTPYCPHSSWNKNCASPASGRDIVFHPRSGAGQLWTLHTNVNTAFTF